MKIDILLVGSKGITFETDVILSTEIEGEMFAVHAGHNKLMHTIVVSHFETGVPVGMAKVHPETAIDEKIAPKYLTHFREKMINFDPSIHTKINTIPEKSA